MKGTLKLVVVLSVLESDLNDHPMDEVYVQLLENVQTATQAGAQTAMLVDV